MEPLSGLRLTGLTAVNLAYGFMLSNQGLLLAPLEAERLFPTGQALGLGGLAVCCGCGQLVGPAAGRWSDRRRASKGQRTPTMILAALGAIALTALLPVLSAYKFGAAFMAAFLMQQLVWNALFTVQVALVPDLVPKEQTSTAGSLGAALMLIGAFGGLIVVRIVPADHDYNHYVVGMSLTVVTTLVAYASAVGKEREARQQVGEAGAVSSSSSLSSSSGWLQDICSSYKFKPDEHPEFAKVLLYKVFYSASVMVKGFLLYFIQDTFRLNNLDVEKDIVANTAVAAEGTAALAAIAVTLLWNRRRRPEPELSIEANAPAAAEGAVDGVSPARFVGMAGTCWMALLWLSPPFVGYTVLQHLKASADVSETARQLAPLMVAGTATWGIGQGFYLAADQALGYALLPSRDESSRYMGLMSVVTAFGAVGGGIIAGGSLHVFGSLGKALEELPSDGPGYSLAGYAAMFIAAVCLNVGCFLVIARIRRPGAALGVLAPTLQ